MEFECGVDEFGPTTGSNADGGAITTRMATCFQVTDCVEVAS